MSGEGTDDSPFPEPSRPARGLFDVLSDAAKRNPPGEFQMPDEDFSVIYETIVLPAAYAFIQSNSHLDLPELCSEAVICLENSYRSALAVPAFQTAEKSLADREIAIYLRTAVRYHFLEKFAAASIVGEVRSRLNRALPTEAIIYDEDKEAYCLPGADGVDLLTPEEIQKLTKDLPLRHGKGFCKDFETNLPTSGQLEAFLLEVLNSTGKSIHTKDFINLAIEIFDVQKNEEVNVDQPLGDERVKTQAEMYGDVDKAEPESSSVNAPASISYHLPAEVEEAKRKILETIKKLDGAAHFEGSRPFFHAFFEFWLWEDHPVAKANKLTATRYAQLTKVADSTRLDQKKKLYLSLSSLNKGKQSRRVSRSALGAALAALREEHVKIFRKRWGLADLTIEETSNE